jgi:hypothetical protein
MERQNSATLCSTPSIMEPTNLDLNLPVFAPDCVPPPQQTMEEWASWLEWCRVELIGPEKFNRWALDPERAPVESPFILD